MPKILDLVLFMGMALYWLNAYVFGYINRTICIPLHYDKCYCIIDLSLYIIIMSIYHIDKYLLEDFHLCQYLIS